MLWWFFFLVPYEAERRVCLVLAFPPWLRVSRADTSLWSTQSMRMSTADFSRSLKAEFIWAHLWWRHPPALTDEVTERGLHLLFRRLLRNLDQLPYFFYSFFLKTNHRVMGLVQILLIVTSQKQQLAVFVSVVLETGSAPFPSRTWPGDTTAAFPLWSLLSLGPDAHPHPPYSRPLCPRSIAAYLSIILCHSPCGKPNMVRNIS